MPDTFSVSVRQAEMLLLNDAHISLKEIQALPFIDDHQEALAVAQELVKNVRSRYRVEITLDPRYSDDVVFTLMPEDR